MPDRFIHPHRPLRPELVVHDHYRCELGVMRQRHGSYLVQTVLAARILAALKLK